MIALDCEMSGLDPVNNCILSIGAIDFENIDHKFYGECYIPENKTFDSVSLTINGFSEDQINDKTKKSLKELMLDFKLWLDGCNEKTLLGQNISIDRAFLNTAFLESNIDFQFHYRSIDIHSVACATFLRDGVPLNIEEGRIKMSLDKIAEMLGMPQEPRPHNALTGATYNAEVFSRLVYKKNLIPEFLDTSIKP
jgi:DNA polymerase III epsilon subunit-like protein